MSYGQSVKLKNITGADSGTYTLSDLPGETTYHFRLRVVASPSGKVGTSAAASGSTKPVGNPVVSATLGAVAQYTATFSYNLSALGEGAVAPADAAGGSFSRRRFSRNPTSSSSTSRRTISTCRPSSGCRTS